MHRCVEHSFDASRHKKDASQIVDGIMIQKLIQKRQFVDSAGAIPDCSGSWFATAFKA